MITGVGVDVAAVHRFDRWSMMFDRLTMAEVYTRAELAFCTAARHRGVRYALCFVGKEATAKAFGTGLGQVSWKDIEVLPLLCSRFHGVHRLRIRLRGAAFARAAALGCNELGGACGVLGCYALAVVLAAGRGAES